MHPHLSKLLLVCIFTTSLFAQDPGKVKFGSISPEDRTLMSVPGDSTAEAYVLYDHQDLDFNYMDSKGPVLKEYFHRRLKLLKPSSFDRADITLTYNRSYQDLGDIKAVIHLPEGGAIKLSGRDFIREKKEDNWESIKFTFPQVTPGAIIEYEWTQMTENIMVPTPYVFQESIPVRWAEFTATIPVYYNYISLGAQGNYVVNEVKKIDRIWGPNFGGAGAYNANSGRVDHTSIRYAMQNIAPFEDQPYTNNSSDYIPKVRLQLQSVQYPGQLVHKVFSDWQETVEELHDRKDFGRYYRNRSNYNKVWKVAEDQIMAGSSDREKIDAAYYYVCRNFEWNEDFSFLASASPNQLLDGDQGNSADLNIVLLALLNEAGIEAHPLLVSLRDRGAPIEFYPIITQFDHLMVYTEVDGQPYLLDANGPSRPPGLPRAITLNHRGWVADEKRPRWVDVEVPQAKQVVMASMTLDEAGIAEVEFNSRLDSYYGFEGRSRLKGMEKDSEAPLACETLGLFPETRVIDHEVVEGADDANIPLSYKVRMTVPAGMATQDYLYVQPVLLPLLDRELADVETRLYPIDFPFPWQTRYIASIQIPEGYMVEEIPESIRVLSQDGGMSATYAASAQPGGMVHVNFFVKLDRTVYQASDYPLLREMYRRIIAMQESTIVLKKAK